MHSDGILADAASARRSVASLRGGYWRVAWTVALLAAALPLLMLPALWNGYPLLQYDTGGYLARWYEGYLVPSRSTVFGLYLHLGEGYHFWPEVAAQSALAIWILHLTMRTSGVRHSLRWSVVTIVILSALTTLPFLASVLLTDIFAGLSVIALYMLLFRMQQLTRWERIALFLLVAFSAATHSATFGILGSIVAAAILIRLVWPAFAALPHLVTAACSVCAGAAMLLAANTALSGELSWTPGGFGIAFGRMLQDGIVKRYLDDHCPDPHIRLCPYRNELPRTADDFLWDDGPFQELGRFKGLGNEMREIVLQSLIAYPLQQIGTAMTATMEQLSLFKSGAGVTNDLPHTYGIFERYLPQEAGAMRRARQQARGLDFTLVNHIHVPVAILSLIGLIGLSLQWRPACADDLSRLAAIVSLTLVANAFICGALSGPHDRYGARVIWLATLVVIVAVARKLDRRADHSSAAG
jgi:hypothetical protein